MRGVGKGNVRSRHLSNLKPLKGLGYKDKMNYGLFNGMFIWTFIY